MNPNTQNTVTAATDPNPHEPIQYLSCDDIMKIFSCGETYFYTALIKDPDFPKSINLGPRMTRWLAHEIREYQNKKIQQQRGSTFNHDH